MRRVRGFLNWLFHSEEMPAGTSTAPSRPAGISFLAWLFQPEEMPVDEKASSPSSDDSSFFSWLFRVEPTSKASPSVDGKRDSNFLSWLFRAERFPDQTEKDPDSPEVTRGPQ